MEIGETKIIDERFVSGSPAASWDEYLVLERLENGFKLDIRVHECVGEIKEYEEDEDGEEIYPEEIEGKKVVTVDDGFAYGGDLVQMDPTDTPEIVFKIPDQDILTGWLKMIGWKNDDVFKSLMKECGDN
jgi:hypothetical protein